MSNPQQQYEGLFGPEATHAEHKVGDKVGVNNLQGEFEIEHIAQTDHGLEYVVYDGVDFPFPVPAHQIREVSKQ